MPDSGSYPFRVAAAAVMVLLAAVACYFMASPWMRGGAVLLAGTAALALVADFSARAPRSHNPQATAPIMEGEAVSLLDHADFQRFIDVIQSPVLVLRANRLAAANFAALRLLGDHVIGEDIRLALRHPIAGELAQSGEEGVLPGPVELVGIGNRDQRWELRVLALAAGIRLVFLTDRSSAFAVERMRTDFVANASHELRTPLSSILGFIETLEDEEAGADADLRKRFLRVMFGEANRMQKLIDDLISLSRIESEKFILPDTPTDIGALAEDVRQVMRRADPQRGGDIRVDCGDAAPMASGDPAQLSQLLHNLIGNAMKYGRPGTPIRVGVAPARSGAMVRLTVEDEGEGIPEEHLPRLTERFYRVDSGRSRAVGGTGLGLSIVKHIVERHRGQLDIRSTVHVGTAITVTLPAVSPAAGPVREPAQAEA